MPGGILKRGLRWANRHSGGIFLAGLAVLAMHNWRLWQRDKATLAQKPEPEPLPPLEKWPDLPVVSVLVAAWNEAAHVEAHIRSFLELRYPHKELLLCAGGEDGTYNQACRHQGPQVTVLEQQPGEGKQRALRRCFSRARGSIIYLTDADCLLDDDSFERVIYPLALREETAVSGSFRPAQKQLENPFIASQAVSQLYSALKTPRYAPGLSGSNCAIDRTTLGRSRGLEEPAMTGTDYVLAKALERLGIRIRQVPESRLVTEYPKSVDAYIRQQSRWLRNVVFHGRRFGKFDEVRSALLSSMTGLFMFGLPPIAFILGPACVVLWALLLGQAWISRGRYLLFSRDDLGLPVTGSLILFQPVMLFLDFIAWTKPLFDHLIPNRRKNW
jgi:cellulose synthase/poly-beta-1,6-N-acetylglucosamine synthase-like glycosyltransferase